MDDGPRSALIGRAREREAIAGALAAAKPGAVVAVEGEPGIGKSRLLEHLPRGRGGGRSDRGRGARVGVRERSPVRAVDGGARPPPGRPRASAAWHGWGSRTRGCSRRCCPRSRAWRPRRRPATGTARTGRCATCSSAWPRPARWSSGWTTCTGPIRRRSTLSPRSCAVRPPRRCCSRLAAREGQVPAALALALAGAQREDRVLALRLAPLSEAEAAALVGEAAAAIFPLTGGNPFYLEQLARVRDTPPLAAGALDDSVPPAVAAALAHELAALAPDSRRVLEAAAVAGDPFEPALAAVVAELPEPAALQALDELLVHALVRPAGVPRRFAFRHPVVRHAVYVTTPHGWRLGAHARAAGELERRGAGPVQRAHHVELAALPGDEDAIALLGAAAAELQAPAPRIAARCPRRRPSPAARSPRAAGAPEPAAAAALRRPGRRGRSRRRPPDRARRAAECRSRRAAGAHGRPRQPGVVARRARGSAAAAAGRARGAALAAIAGPHPPAPRARAHRADGLRPRRGAGARRRRSR